MNRMVIPGVMVFSLHLGSSAQENKGYENVE